MPAPLSPAIRTVLAGWAVCLLFTLLVALSRSDDRAAMTVFAVVGVLLGGWVLARRSRASLVASLAVGSLHTLEQVAYTWASATEPLVDGGAVASDAVGLVSGLLIAGGALAALREQRRDRRPVQATT